MWRPAGEFTKNMIVFSVAVATAVAALSYFLPDKSNIGVLRSNESVIYSYEMPRVEPSRAPEPVAAVRAEGQLPPPTAEVASSPNEGQSDVGAVIDLSPQSSPSDAKSSGGKKPKSDKAAVKKKGAKNKNAKKKVNARRRPLPRSQKVAAKEIKNTWRTAIVPEDDTNSGYANPTPGPISYDPNQTPQPQQPAPKGDEEDEQELHESTWQSLLQTNPTPENIQKFQRARAAGKISDAAFYQIVTILIQDNGADRRRAGIALLDRDLTPRTYEYIVGKLNDSNPELKNAVRQLYGTYTAPAKFGVLQRVLTSSSDKVVLTNGLSQVERLIAIAASSPVPPTSPPASPSPAPAPADGTTASVSPTSTVIKPQQVAFTQLSGFVSPLKNLTQHPDSRIAEKAKDLLGRFPVAK